MLITGIALGFAAFLAMVAVRCGFRVRQGHVAVLSTFGAAVKDAHGHSLRVFGPGLHFKAPWQHAHDVIMMEQNLELSGEKGGSVAMASDGTLLRLDSILRYQPVEAQLEAFVFGLRAPMEHITGLFQCLLRNEIANFQGVQGDTQVVPAGTEMATRRDLAARQDGGSYALIRRERRMLNERIERFCRERMGDRYGVRFNAVDLTDILPPDELADALNAVINAEAEAEALYARAEGECQQLVLSASRGVEIAGMRATAVEREMATLCGVLEKLHVAGHLPAYVARRRAEVLGEARSSFVKGGA
jgi:regulator of protease activity HflC (stomatin/prohibitin superfamily)